MMMGGCDEGMPFGGTKCSWLKLEEWEGERRLSVV
jgi:hypothetical protein